jgi:hypothetical protein
MLAVSGDDLRLRRLPLSVRKPNLARPLARRPDGIFAAPFERGEIGPDLFGAACDKGNASAIVAAILLRIDQFAL